MSFLRAEAWLGSKMGTGLGSLWNGWDLLFPWHLNLQVEPGLRSVIEDPPCLKTLRRSYLWSNILSGGICSSEGTELLMKNWGRLLSHILSNILICFLLAVLSWKILVCFQQRFDWRFCLLKHSSGFHWLATCSILDNNHASPTAILLRNQLWRKRGHWSLNPYVWSVSSLWSQFKWTWYNEIFWWFQWLSDFRSWDGLWLWLQVCTSKDVAGSAWHRGMHFLFKKVKVLSWLLRPGIWSFWRKWDYQAFGQTVMMMSFFPCCYLGWILFQCKWSLISCFLPKPKGSGSRWLVFVYIYKSFWNCEYHMKWLEVRLSLLKMYKSLL